MKKRVRLVSGMFLSMGLVLSSMSQVALAENANLKVFADVKGHWASESIVKWTSRGMINGYANGMFKPDEDMKIAEFVTIMNRLFGFAKKSDGSFSDVKANAWYADELLKAKEAGYLEIEGNEANPKQSLQAGKAATMLSKLFGKSKSEILEIAKNVASRSSSPSDDDTLSRAEVVAIIDKLIIGFNEKWFESVSGTTRYVVNKGGATLGYSTDSGVTIVEKEGYAFKDLNQNGSLDAYEDWRLNADERAKNLASQMTVELIAGLMLYSSHQSVPGGTFGGSTYNGKSYKESGAKPWDLSDDQKSFLTKDSLRHVLVTTLESPEIAARWNNNVQALVEGEGLGIPANNSSDPRHTTVASTEYNAGAGGKISMWPETLGLAATFDPELTLEFGEIAAQEYRALGISTALSPQIDMATDPRWSRFNGTFGEDSLLSTDMARAYVDGFQTSKGSNEIAGGWGYTSVNAMVKHWPGGGSGEGGRDAHFSYGKFAVYPGNNFEEHLLPFVNGAFKLNGETGSASAVMPYYTISYDQDKKNGENVGNSYSSYIINDLLRTKYGYDGVVTTDWGITDDSGPTVDTFSGRPFGVDELTVAERHYKVIMSGVDQFGGNNEAGPVIEAYKIGVEEHGEAFMRNRFEQSAVRLLKNIFRVGLFENAYLNVDETVATVGNPEFMEAGYEAQLKSIVMLKNKDQALPLKDKATVYIPKKFYPETVGWFNNVTPSKVDYPVNMEIVKKYFNVTDKPEEADYGIVFIDNPQTGTGYNKADLAAGGNGYVPISLQYGTYKATQARATSIAGGDPLEDFTNRTYLNKSVTASNIKDLESVLETKKAMNGKPVIVSLLTDNPVVVKEFESSADAILVNFGVQDQALMDIMSGNREPSGLLPMQMPKDMETVEKQFEDVPHDMEVHVDSEGNAYNFAFGMNWKGVIQDSRTAKYAK
ncbi:glycoside hydrolase family 3 N-terminal domain-containing protein [Paenibacillus sp. LHD-117]|uniref:glycoside hydrolase family 3 N-terminal domain-containing protein n=1 Tax=Paenibacillus sp. LHD-117 TaxID=3071412 RepID=UPI0027E00AB1|nr:glycoside hydrolase family 3 N-terminal domain-containing protein [Paenibacillus sp. LHD-117]MDQ6418034.1 glycoside hydrolase family 3 N-terminal domain-containing protein [Paenibacillus sp. LHD-117]